VLVGDADGDVSEAAEVAQGELAEAVDPVPSDAVVNGRRARGRSCLEATVEDSGRGLAVKSAVGPAVVVVGPKGL
jgi:hypothetical protein